MRAYVEIERDARDEPAFSNGTSGAIWMGAWCDRCVHDRAMRDENAHPDPAVNSGILGCPLVAVSLIGKTPVEWFEQEHPQDYHCVEFRDEDDPGDYEPQPLPDPPGMEAMLPREPYTAPLMFTANADRMARADR